MPVRWRQDDLPGKLGDAPSVRDRSDDKAGPRCHYPETNLLHRFGRMVHHGVGSVRSRRQAVEDASRPSTPIATGRCPTRGSQSIRTSGCSSWAWWTRIFRPAPVQSSICPARPRRIVNAGISTWERSTTPSSRRKRWSARVTDRVLFCFVLSVGRAAVPALSSTIGSDSLVSAGRRPRVDGGHGGPPHYFL